MYTNKKLSKTLESARRMGEGEDKILAHIHPIEAEELRRKYGGNINPRTGLPQYGFKLKHVLKAPKKLLHSKPVKNIIRIAAPIAGHMIAGPIGAGIGGGLARGVTGNGSFLRNFGRGALPAAALSAGASILGGGMNMPFLQGGNGLFGMQGPQNGLMGRVLGRGPGSVVNGLSNFGSSAFGRNEIPSETGYSAGDMQEPPGLMEKLGSGASGIMNAFGGPIPASLLAASLFALSKKKDKIIQPPNSPYRNPFPEDRAPVMHARPLRRRLKVPRGLEHEVDGEPGVFFDEVNPSTETYAEGGPVRGVGGGTDDNINSGVKDKTFVWDATSVSLLGDGNTENGFHKLKDFEKRLLSSRYAQNRGNNSPRDVQIRISSGEYRMDPMAVAALGHMNGGDINTGIKAIQDIRRNLKSQKGFSGKKIPPKAKPIMQYLGA